MEGRLYGAAKGEEPLSDKSRRVPSHRVASRRITRDTRFIVAATLVSKETVLRFTGPDLAEPHNRRRTDPGYSANVIAVITTE